ncbi:NUDIX hydrolase [Frankia sp. Mgl5]|nr:NUDIX hydrolase [Frankia sp. Mgl5]MCK9929542.1 NUDIX hydrolase [Frankia sp. Mgl5]
MHSVSVAAVTRRDDGRVLCIQRRDTGAWQIPGGVLERGETFEDGLRREVREETGALGAGSPYRHLPQPAPGRRRFARCCRGLRLGAGCIAIRSDRRMDVGGLRWSPEVFVGVRLWPGRAVCRGRAEDLPRST